MTSATRSVTDFQRFAGLRQEARQDEAGALREVAREFEALFIQMMLKAAREASPAESEFDSQEVQLYREMFDNQIALQMADEGRLGFADMLARQLPRAEAVNDGPVELRLPERRIFPEANPHFSPVPEPDVADEVVDITNWQARITNRAQDDRAREFAAQLLGHAQRAAARLGTTPEVLVAQAALETGWGRHVMDGGNGRSSHNLFGIKADRSWDGDTVTRRTLEYFDGRPVKVNAAFRSYADFGAAFDDYARFIQENPRYQQALERAADPRAYATALQRAGYATDPQYARKILQIHDQLAALSTAATTRE
ncbi:MAG: flagellar assembly peptidoglycan hydrolase FlgJ [Gammaproteobacteria bacterium]